MAAVPTTYVNETTFRVEATDTRETIFDEFYFGADAYFGQTPDIRQRTTYFNESRFDDTILE